MLPLTGVLFSVLKSPLPYLDPGSGSFLLQLLIAGLAGVSIFIGASWKKIKRIFRRKNADPVPEDELDEYDD